MISKSDAYTRNEAYNFLKGLLGIPRKSYLNRNFFNLFFIETQGFYVIRKPEEFIKKLFTEQGIVELNNTYHEMKKTQKTSEAKKIAEDVINKMRKELAN